MYDAFHRVSYSVCLILFGEDNTRFYDAPIMQEVYLNALSASNITDPHISAQFVHFIFDVCKKSCCSISFTKIYDKFWNVFSWCMDDGMEWDVEFGERLL